MVNGIDLVRIFSEWNLREFGGQLRIPTVRFNSRLKTSAGRFIPHPSGAIIEIASYLCEEENGENMIKDTLGHEMIHFWLWVNEKPYGHTSEFKEKMEAIGVSRYNSVPRHRPFKHIYTCKSCEQKIFVRKKLTKAACAACCNQYAEGKYHSHYILRLVASGDQITPHVAQVKRTG